MAKYWELHFWKHVWSKWTDPYWVTSRIEDGKEFGHFYQKRICQECGYVETRMVEGAK